MSSVRSCATLLLLVLALPAVAAVRGTVIDGDGNPLAGARVSLFGFESVDSRRARLLSAQPEPVPLASTQTDAKGNFSLESPKTAADVHVFLRGFSPVSAGVEPDDDAGAIVLPRAETKWGSVRAGGKGVAGAVVSITYPTEYVTRTDEQGRYEAPDPKRARGITVIHPEFAVDDETFPPRGGVPASKLARTLVHGSARSGRVVGTDGQTPVAGATISMDGWPLAKSGEDGTFTVAHAPAKWSMAVARRDSAIGQRAFAADGSLTIRMEKGARINGRVIDRRTRMPVHGAVVWLGARRMGSSAFPGSSTATDAKGFYSFVAAPGSWMVGGSHPAYGVETADVAASAGQQVSKDLVLEPLARISGTVSNEEKRPLSGAVIRVDDTRRGRGGIRPMRGIETSATAPDGRFLIRLSAEDEVRLRASKKGLPPATSELLQVGPGERRGGIAITITSGIEVTGLVTDRNGDPLAGVLVSSAETQGDGRMMMQRIIIGGGAGSDEELVSTAKDGTFSLRLKQGTYDFTLRREGYAPRIVRGHVVQASGTEPVEVSLEPSVEITGRVVRGGAGVEGVSLFTFDGLSDASVVTAGDGSFTLTGLAAGQVRVGLRKEDDFVQEQRTLTAPGRDVVVELPPGGRVSGRVIEKGTRRPITTFQAGVSASRSGGGMVMMAPPLLRSFTSDDGSFVLENVPLGSINLVASAPGYASGRLSVTLEQGKPLEGIDLELDTGVRLAGRVTAASGSPLADMTVRLVPAPGRPFSTAGDRRTTTDTNGEYAFETLEAGEETVEFSHAKHLPSRKSVTLKGKETRLDVQLESGLRVSGVVVTESGAPVADATVTARGNQSWESARSRADGTFELESIAPGRYTVSASLAGYADGRVDDYDPAAGTPLRIVLRAGGTIYGHVSGLSEQELQFAMVEVRGARGMAQASVDSSGNYRLESVEPGTIRVSASVSSGGFAGRRTSPVRTVELTEGGTQQVDLEFPSGTVVSGRIRRNGLPLGGALVQFQPRTAAAQTTAATTADDQGSYSVSGLEDGDYTVSVVDLQRFSPYRIDYQVRGSATLDIDFTTATVRGQVVDASTGEPIADASVQLRPSGDQGSPRTTRSAPSDMTGAFAIEHVAPGAYAISATREGYAGSPTEMQIGEAGANGVQVRLSRTDGVRLRVVDARDGRPIRAFVTVYDAQNRVVHDGRMSYGGGTPDEMHLPLSTGTFTATVWSSGYATRTVVLSSPSTQTVPMTRGGTLVVESKHSGTRRARLVDAAGRPYELAMRPNGLVNLNPRPGLTTLENVAPGTYTLTLLSEDETSVADSVPVVVQEGATTRVEI